MGSYITRRILYALLTLFIITLFVFVTVRFATPYQVIDSPIDISLFQDYSVPIHIHYWHWLSAMFHGDFGQSIWTSRYLTDEIALRFPVTFELLALSFIFSQLIAIPLGLLSAIRRSKIATYISNTIEAIFSSMPIFWLATLVIVLPNIWWHWSPPQRYISFSTDWLANLRQFIVPALIIGLTMSVALLRNYRTTVFNILAQDYIRTARAKDLQQTVVFIRHGFRHALVLVMKVYAAQLPVVIGTMVIMEFIFNLRGIGWLFIDALNKRDSLYISGTIFILAGVCLVVFVLTDLVCAWLDPRLRHPDLQQVSE